MPPRSRRSPRRRRGPSRSGSRLGVGGPVGGRRVGAVNGCVGGAAVRPATRSRRTCRRASAVGGAATPTVEPWMTVRVNGVVDASPPTASCRPAGARLEREVDRLRVEPRDVTRAGRRPSVAVRLELEVRRVLVVRRDERAGGDAGEVCTWCTWQLVGTSAEQCCRSSCPAQPRGGTACPARRRRAGEDDRVADALGRARRPACDRRPSAACRP